MLAYGIVGDFVDEYYQWARPPALSRCTTSTTWWLRCSALSTLESQTLKTLPWCYRSMRQGVVHGWWEVLTVCTLFSACQVPIMTLTCCSVLLYSLGLLRS
jgi:hypothetical protein